MTQHTILLLCVLSVGVCQEGTVRAADPTSNGQRDLPAEVRGVLAARCAGCHGPNLARPKGRFGYVLDLERVANNREMVVPGSPSESELWNLVQRDEMPPPDAPAGTLSAHQKEAIEAWIAAGAPFVSPSPSPSLQPITQPPAEVAAEPAVSPAGRQFLPWLGKFHLLVLHFPIALLLAAAVGEGWSIVHRSRVPAQAVRFCVLLGAISAAVTVALGWLHALSGYGAGMPLTLTLHRWLGTAAGVWVVGTAILSERDSRREVRSQVTRALLFIEALLIGLAAHFGGILANGEDFFAW